MGLQTETYPAMIQNVRFLYYSFGVSAAEHAFPV